MVLVGAPSRIVILLCVLSAAFAVRLVAGPEAADRSVLAAAPPCSNFLYHATPPENIGVAITYQGGPITGVVYPDFKSYVKDVLPYEWLQGWGSAAYQAGAMAVKTFGWYYVNNWSEDRIFNGNCYHVEDYTNFQVYCAGIGTPNSGANCHGLGTRPASHAIETNYAIEQTWNWLLNNNGLIYPTHHNSGFSDDACGETHPQPGLYAGSTMSQWGSQACALGNYSWAQIVNAYYFNNTQNPPLYQGNHIYGQWHAAMSSGTVSHWPVSTSVNPPTHETVWKFRIGNSCGAPTTQFAYGADNDMKVVGDWDGNGGASQGIVRIEQGQLVWYLKNEMTNGKASGIFPYGVAGDIPVVGDWDGNGTWTVGVKRGGRFFLKNQNAPGYRDYEFEHGGGGDLPIFGKWVSTVVSQPMTVGIYRLVGAGVIEYHLRYSNSQGPAEVPIFTYGGQNDRPVTGDYNGTSNTQFGIGIVRDYWPPQTCSGLPHTQEWHLRYTPSGGDAQVPVFRYELSRP